MFYSTTGIIIAYFKCYESSGNARIDSYLLDEQLNVSLSLWPTVVLNLVLKRAGYTELWKYKVCSSFAKFSFDS